MKTLQVELSTNDDDSKELLDSLGSDLQSISSSDHFEGDSLYIQAIVAVTTASISAIASIVIARLSANKHVKVKIKGVEITGMDASNVLATLKALEKE